MAAVSGGGVYGLRRLADPQLRRLILIVVAFVLVAFRLLQFAVFTTQIQWGYDFSAYWSSAGHLLDGAPIYSAEQLAGPYAPQEQFLYLYPPPLAAFAIPWALIPGDYRVAAWGWTVLGAVILAATILTVARAEGLGDRVRRGTGLGPWILVAAAIGFPPVIGELVLGNVHLMLLGLLGLAWLGIRRGDVAGDRIAGFAVGVAAVVKVFPGLILLWFLLTRRWQGAAFVIVGAAAVTLLALPFTGIQPWLDYPTVLANLSAPSDTTDTLAPTVWLAGFIGFLPARVAVTGAGLVLLGVVRAQVDDAAELHRRRPRLDPRRAGPLPPLPGDPGPAVPPAPRRGSPDRLAGRRLPPDVGRPADRLRRPQLDREPSDADDRSADPPGARDRARRP